MRKTGEIHRTRRPARDSENLCRRSSVHPAEELQYSIFFLEGGKGSEGETLSARTRPREQAEYEAFPSD